MSWTSVPPTGLVDRTGGIPHIEKLGQELGDHIIIVKDLHDIVL